MINLAIMGKFAAALLVVVALILLTGRLLRMTNTQKYAGKFFAPATVRQLRLVEVLPLDFKRKLVLVEHGGKRHLLLCGAEQDIVIESTSVPLSAENVTPHAA